MLKIHEHCCTVVHTRDTLLDRTHCGIYSIIILSSFTNFYPSLSLCLSRSRGGRAERRRDNYLPNSSPPRFFCALAATAACTMFSRSADISRNPLATKILVATSSGWEISLLLLLRRGESFCLTWCFWNDGGAATNRITSSWSDDCAVAHQREEVYVGG